MGKCNSFYNRGYIKIILWWQRYSEIIMKYMKYKETTFTLTCFWFSISIVNIMLFALKVFFGFLFLMILAGNYYVV